MSDVGSQDCGRFTLGCGFNFCGQPAGSGRQLGIESTLLSFGQVPQHFVQLLNDFEDSEHRGRGRRILDPTRAPKRALGNRLACAEAVKDGTSAESARPQTLMDVAGKVAGHVRAGRSSRFVDREISRAGKAKGCATEGEAVAAVRAKGWRNSH